MLQSSAYRQNAKLRDSNSRSRSVSKMLDNSVKNTQAYKKRGHPSFLAAARSGPSCGIRAVFFESAPQCSELGCESTQVLWLKTRGGKDASGYFEGFFTQRPAPSCQAYADLPLVRPIARPREQPQGLEALDQRCQCVRLEKQFLAQRAHCLIVLIPERNHQQVLRVGESQLIEQGLVDAVERMASGVDRKAQKRIELQRVVGVSGLSRHTCLLS